MKFCISTCFPKERCSLTWHYQICSPFIQGVTVLTPHSPTSPFGNRCLSFPEGHEITAGGAGDSLWGRAEPSLSTGSPTPHRKNTVCSEKSGHSFLPPPLPLTLWAPPVPQDGRKLIHQQNPNYFLTGLGTAPQKVPSSASWWGRNTGNGPSLWWHGVISSSLISNCFLRPPSPTI